MPFSEVFSTVTTTVDFKRRERKMDVYPNPVNTTLNVRLNHTGDGGQLKIYNQTGLLVTSEEKIVDDFEFDFSNFEPGIYFLTYENDKNRMTKKIVKY